MSQGSVVARNMCHRQGCSLVRRGLLPLLPVALVIALLTRNRDVKSARAQHFLLLRLSYRAGRFSFAA